MSRFLHHWTTMMFLNLLNTIPPLFPISQTRGDISTTWCILGAIWLTHPDYCLALMILDFDNSAGLPWPHGVQTRNASHVTLVLGEQPIMGGMYHVQYTHAWYTGGSYMVHIYWLTPRKINVLFFLYELPVSSRKNGRIKVKLHLTGKLA